MTNNQLINIKPFSWGNIDFILFASFMISFFLHYRINGFIAMLVIIYFGIKLIFKKVNVKGGLGLIFFPALFITFFIGQLYSDDLREGWTIIERNIALFVLPFAAKGILDLNQTQRKFLMTVFIAAGFFATIVCLWIATSLSIEAGSIYTIPNNTHFLYNRFMHHSLSDPIGMHAVYFSMYLALINGTLLYRLLNNSQSLKSKIGIILLFSYFTVLIYLLKSANIAVGFAIVCSLVLIQRFRENIKKSPAKFGLIGLAIILFAFLGVKNKVERFNLNYDMADEGLKPIGIRLSIWDCTWQGIQENLILGAGTGDTQHVLREKYETNHFTIGLQHDFNSHNMFLQYWLSNGLLGLTLFIGGLFVLFRKSIRYKNVIFLSFVLLFVLFSISESTLRTQKGLLFFVFFGGLFYWYPQLWMKKSTDS